jgi:hypothetical protein
LDLSPFPASAKLTINGATQNPTGGEFALHYDPSQVLIYTDQNCTNEVQSDAPVISDSQTTTLYAKAVTAGQIEIDLEYNGNILDTVYETARPVLGMTAYRTGDNYGTAVSEADRASGDPSNYVILVDDGYDQDPAGVQDNIDYNTSLINQGEAINVDNQNIARITLDALGPLRPGDNGTISLTFSASSSVRLFDSSGHELTAADLSTGVDGSGYLAGLATHNVDIYVEGLQADPDFSLTYGYVTGSLGQGIVQGSASVHIAIANLQLVDASGNKLDFLPIDEDLQEMLAGDPADVDAPYGALTADEFKIAIDGLHGQQVNSLTIKSDAGGQYQDDFTDTDTGAESNLFADLLDDSGQSLGSDAQSQIRSDFGVNALGSPEDGIVTVAFQTTGGKDAFAIRETTAASKEVFAFEGRGGFPVNWTEGGSDPPPTGTNGRQVMLSGKGSGSQVLNYWYTAAIAGATTGTITALNPAGNVAWHYYSQDAVSIAEKQILAIAKANHGSAYDTITILGYSNGGDAALAVAAWLKTQNVTVDLAITCDPVPIGLNPFSHVWNKGGAMPTARPTNVINWYNFYQNCDTSSLLGRFRIWGRTVTSANSNTFVSPATFNADPVLGPLGQAAIDIAHICMPELTTVCTTITTDVKALPSSKKSFSAS